MLVVKLVVLLGRIVEVVVVGACLTLDHRLQLVALLHQFLVELAELISLANRVLQLLRQRVQVVLFLGHHRVDLVTSDLLLIALLLIELAVLLLKVLVDQKLVLHRLLQVSILLQKRFVERPGMDCFA